MPSSSLDRITNAAAWLCLAIAAAVFLLPIANPDMWWHFSAARFIIDNGAFPREEWLSHTMAGVPWADFEWGVQMLWYGLFRIGGLTSLWMLKAGLFFSIAGVLWSTLGRYGAGFAARALGVFAWALGTTIGNDVRPENFSLLFFALLWLLLENRRLSPSHDRRVIPGLAAAFAIWANMHAGFAYGLVLLFIYAAGEYGRRQDKTLGLACAAAAVSVLINPYGAAVYLVTLQHAAEGETLQAFIREWGEATLLAPSLIPFWMTLIAAYAALLRGQLRRLNAPVEHIAVLLIFSVSAVSHVRTGVYFLTVAIPILAAALMRIPASRNFIPVLALLGSGFFFAILAPAFKGKTFFRPHYIPDRATAFLEKEKGVLAGKPLFNPWHWGGYLGYHLYPDYRIFTDGRYPFHSMLPAINEAKQAPGRYHAFLVGKGVEIAMVQRVSQYVQTPVMLKDGTREMLMRPFYLHFLSRKHWGLVHWDPRALVFVRRDSVPQEWLREREYRYFRPDDLSAALLLLRDGMITLSDIEAEVERYRSAPIPEDERAQVSAWLKLLREEKT